MNIAIKNYSKHKSVLFHFYVTISAKFQLTAYLLKIRFTRSESFISDCVQFMLRLLLWFMRSSNWAIEQSSHLSRRATVQRPHRTQIAYGLLFYSDFKQICAFVAKRDMLRILAFLNFFDSDLTQTNAIWLRLYSDIWTKKSWLGPLVAFSIYFFFQFQFVL